MHSTLPSFAVAHSLHSLQHPAHPFSPHTAIQHPPSPPREHFNHISLWLWLHRIAQRLVEISAQRLKCTFVSSFYCSSDRRLHLYKIFHCYFDVFRVFFFCRSIFVLFVQILFCFLCLFLVAPIEQKPRARPLNLWILQLPLPLVGLRQAWVFCRPGSLTHKKNVARIES